jgi:DNA-binding transcriptional ArsR family regulator
MEKELAAKRLAELGHHTRLSIFRYLVRVGHQGAPVGQIQNKLGIPGSTLSHHINRLVSAGLIRQVREHHINRLVSAGLIRQVRESRTLYCVPQFDVLQELVDFLQAECCIDEGSST